MRFRSTINNEPQVSFKDAILNCLPPSGGLYVPSEMIDLRQHFLKMDDNISYSELVAAVAPPLLSGELSHISASMAAKSAFDFEPELKQLDENISILNLYKGPTGTFKDFSIAFLAAILDELLQDNYKAMILSAVRGDGGKNLEKAFYGRKGLTSVLLYPSGPIRGLDPKTFISEGGNIIPIQVKGNLDDCQRLVNQTINDRPFSERYKITSANTINPGRLLPQAFYYLYAFIKIRKRLSGDLFFSVPSGNFGNLISGLYAWKFGLPVSGFIAAMNTNNAFGEYIQGRDFKPRPVITTNSPALDVGIPSNYPRLNAFYGESPAVMRNMVVPASIDDNATVKAMEEAWKQYGILIDPHTAVAFAAARNLLKTERFECSHIIVFATGHPAKSAALVRTATGQIVEIPEKLAQIKKEVNPIALIDPQLDALEGAIASCV